MRRLRGAIVAVVEVDEDRRAAAARALPGVASLVDLESLAVEAVDFVDVATPPRAHASAVVSALDRGWHVLCEKPLAVSPADVDAIVAAHRRTGKTVFTVHNWKQAPLFRRLRELAADGAVGRVRELEWRVSRVEPPAGATRGGRTWRTDPAEAGGGILVDHGWHAVYLATFVLGAAPVGVRARVWTVHAELAVEDSAEVVIDFGEARALVSLTWAAAERATRGRLRGDRGEIEIGDDFLEVRAAGRRAERLAFSPGLGASSYHPEWFGPVLEEFREEVLDDVRRGRSLAEAVACADLIHAAYASQGENLPLPSREDLWT